MKKRTTSQIICQNFNLSQPQTIFQDYKCSLAGGITSFGRLYVGQNHFMFISNMFGIVKKCVIDIDNIQQLTNNKEKNKITIRVLQTKKDDLASPSRMSSSFLSVSSNKKDSIISQIKQSNNKQTKYVFGDFKNDKSFKLMKALWTRDKIDSQILKSQQEEDVLKQNSQQFLLDLISSQTISNVQSSREKSMLNQNNFLSQSQSQKQKNIKLISDGKIEANYFDPKISQNTKQKLVDIQLPCSVSQYYQFFVADEASLYPRNHHFQFKKAENVVLTKWKNVQQTNTMTRQLKALIKVQGVPFINQAGMSQVWILKKPNNFEQIGIQIDIVTQMSDVPYASYFTTQQFINITPLDNNTRCKMSVQNAVVFNKGTYLKNTMIKRALGDSKIDYETWVKNANRLLQQLRKKKQIDLQSPIKLKRQDKLQKNDERKIQDRSKSNQKINKIDLQFENSMIKLNSFKLIDEKQVEKSQSVTQDKIYKIEQKIKWIQKQNNCIIILLLLILVSILISHGK